MANAVYNKCKQSLVRGEIDWVDNTIKAILIDTGAYTFSQTHDFLNDISGPAIISTAIVTGKTDTNGQLGAASISFTGVPVGESVGAIIFYKDTGSSATSNLIAYIDTGVTGLPIASTTGNDVTFILGSGLILSI